MSAPDIVELVEHLRATHRDGDLYRGQTFDFPALVPSVLRRGIVAGTEHEPIVRIDRSRVLDDDKRNKLRRKLLNELIGVYGLGLGNLLAQQYGLSSECIDVTENPRIAAFFATRRWPEYAHYETTGLGVIYRFRLPLRAEAPAELTFDAIGQWMEMGELNGVFFDSFVPDGRLLGTLDRDHWFRWQEGVEAEVATLPLRIHWSDIAAIVTAAPRFGPRPDAIPLHEWRISRVAAQAGGLLRPRFFWKASIPSRYETVHSLGAMQDVYSPGATQRRPKLLEMDDGLPWPRAVPSLAFKKEIIGVENLRLRPECEAFPFRHSPRRVCGFYRRTLWPEPSEDPVYGRLWIRAIPYMWRVMGGEPVYGVDDPEHGLLDRGYRVANEVQTMDAREIPDLMRGQLEDAREALRFGEIAALHCWHEAGAHLALGDGRSAVKSAVRGLRMDRDCVEALLALGSALNEMRKGKWAMLAYRRALSLAPEHSVALHAIAEFEIDHCDPASAAEKLKLAIARLDRLPYRYPEYSLLGSLALAAGVIGDEETVRHSIDRLDELRMPVNEAELRNEIAKVRAMCDQSATKA